MKYPDQGKTLVIKALHDSAWQVRWTAYRLLMRLEEVDDIRKADAGEAKYCQHYPDFRRSESTEVHSLAKNHLKSYLEEELGQYSGAIVGTDFPVSVAPNPDRIADVVAIFPTGYMVALMVATEPIKPQELNHQSTALFNAGVDVIWWLGEKADTLRNRQWSFQYCDWTYILNLSTCPITDNREQTEVEFNELSKYSFKSLTDKVKRINWLLHNHHTRVTAIAKMNDGYWQVTDDEQLMNYYLGFPRKLFPPSGVQAMKQRAHTIAQIKAASQALMAKD